MAEREKRVNSRSKGRAFEQQIATEFRLNLGDPWTVTRNQTDRQGGQLAGVAGEFTIEHADDGVEFPFCVECKAHESFDYHQFWTGLGPFTGFWRQACDQAQVAGKEPLLILKRNRGPILCAVELGAWDLDAITPPWLVLTVDGDHILVLTFESFLAARPWPR